MTADSTIPLSPADLQRLARSFKRAALTKRYSHGSVKRLAMAMINQYLRLAGQNFAKGPHDLHVVM